MRVGRVREPHGTSGYWRFCVGAEEEGSQLRLGTSPCALGRPLDPEDRAPRSSVGGEEGSGAHLTERAAERATRSAPVLIKNAAVPQAYDLSSARSCSCWRERVPCPGRSSR